MREKIKKIGIISVLALVVAFSAAILLNLSPNDIVVTADATSGEEHTHDGFTQWTSSTSLPNSAGSYYLTSDITLSGTWTVPSGTTNLCLNDHAIRYTGGTGSVFIVNSGRVLNLFDCGETEHKYTINSPSENGAGLATVNDALTENYKTFTGGYITGGKGYYVSNIDVCVGGCVRIGYSSDAGGTFNMYGGTLIGNSVSASSAYGGAVYAKAGGTFKMYGGAIIGNKAASGAGVFVEGNNANTISRFSMYGGTIKENAVTSSSGGGVYVSANTHCLIEDGTISDNYTASGGAGVFFSGISFTMNGGTISGNVSKNSGSGSGAGIYCMSRSGTFTINGGTIRDNIADRSAGIYVSPYVYSGDTGLTFTMNGGTIENNSATYQYGGCGGVSVSGNISGGSVDYAVRFTMRGGEIKNNTSAGSYGGLSVSGSAKFNLEGGSITGNTAERDYGGLYVSSGVPFSISGSPVITGNTDKKGDSNLYLYNASTVLAVKELGEGALIGVTLPSGMEVFTSGWSTNMGDAKPSDYFTSDKGYYVILSEGEAAIVDSLPHLHEDGKTFKFWNSTTSLPSTAGSYCLSGDVTLTSTWTVPSGTTNLCLNGHGIKMTGTSRIIHVSGATLNLYDCDTTTTHKYTIQDPVQGAGLAVVDDEATGEDVMTFVGGYITGARTSEWGAAVCIENGGLFTLNGGTIIGNKMSGSFGGGGVALKGYSGDRFVMNGGAIIGNMVANGWGGGVYFHEGASFTMTGGVIKENYASKGGNGSGGGISAEGGSSSFIMTGGKIINNVAQNCGGNINLAAATIKISGDITVSGGKLTSGARDNVYVNGGRVFQIIGALDQNASIAIKRQIGAFTSGWSTYMEGEDPFCYFTSDNDSYEIRLSGGEAYVGPHVHTWTYSASGNVITATCLGVERGTCDIQSQTLTITAENKDYDGQALTATLINSSGWTSSNGLSLPDIDYSGNTDAGTYAASITIDGETASVEFTISPIDVTVTITGNFDTADYNGEEHSISGYEANTESNLYDVENDFTFIGEAFAAATDAGTANMNLTSSQFENTNTNFKTVTFEIIDGYITVEPIDVTVTITGNFDTADYDGEEHSISGYIANTESNLYDVENDFTFSGEAVAARTNAGTQYMELDESQFENINPNFKTVTFEITDGYFTVEPIDVTVAIIGNVEILDYNGQEQFSIGYEAVPENDLYDAENDITFSGEALAAITNVGTEYMNLTSAQFENNNPNFKTVTFEVTDGYITVEPIDVTVFIIGDAETVDYDGEEHFAEGYDAVTENDLYNVEKDFLFSGAAFAQRTDAGVQYMELDESQFENINQNFATVTFEIIDGFIEVEPINASVTITGQSSTVDYDGKTHMVSDYFAKTSNALYDVDSDFTFDGKAVASLKNAGIKYMGLDESQFENTNPNFATVTFIIIDGYQEVLPIDTVVFITGNTAETDYNGEEQSVSGFKALSVTHLYNVDKDFTFSGTALAALTNAGTQYMGLDESQFENINPNFKTVTFEITDGYITVNTVDAVVIIAPTSTDPIYSGEEQELVSAGEAEGGTLLYALSEDGENAPDDSSYVAELSTAKDVGNYYVWYKVESDENHNDVAPKCVKVTLSEDDWITIYGTVYESDGVSVVEGATVTLIKGNQTIDATVSGEDGEYRFIVSVGVYNIVAEYEATTQTILVTVLEDTMKDIVLSYGKTESVLNVDTDDDDYFGVVVGGLDSEAQSIREAEGVSDNVDVSVVMTVKTETEEIAENAEFIREVAEDKSLEFFEIKLEKTIDNVTTELCETQNVLEIVIPYAETNKKGLTVYSYHGEEVRTFTESDSKADGTFKVDKENGFIYVYSKTFSTYAIGYTPYYKVSGSISLGSFGGTATITLQSVDGGKTYTFNTVAAGSYNFSDVPSGDYIMTVTWVDGAKNQISVPFTVGKKTASAVRPNSDKGEVSPSSAKSAKASETKANSLVENHEETNSENKAVKAEKTIKRLEWRAVTYSNAGLNAYAQREKEFALFLKRQILELPKAKVKPSEPEQE